MTRSPGDISYRILINASDFKLIYSIMEEQCLLWAAFPDVDEHEWSEELFCKKISNPAIYVLGGYINGHTAGILILWPVAEKTLCAEIGVCAFRPYFVHAKDLFLGALSYALNNLHPAPASFIGRIAAPNRHILAMYADVGFHRLGNVPGMMWHSRKKRFVDATLVIATPENIRAAIKNTGEF